VSFVVGLFNALAASQLTETGTMRREWMWRKLYQCPLGVSRACRMAGEAMVIAKCRYLMPRLALPNPNDPRCAIGHGG
jgi:hypothetical protein